MEITQGISPSFVPVIPRYGPTLRVLDPRKRQQEQVNTPLFESPTEYFGVQEATDMITDLLNLNQKQRRKTSLDDIIQAYATKNITQQNDTLYHQTALPHQQHHLDQPYYTVLWSGNTIGAQERQTPAPVSRITCIQHPGSTQEVIFAGELFFQTADVPEKLRKLFPLRADNARIHIAFSDQRRDGKQSAMKIHVSVSPLSYAFLKPSLEAVVDIDFHSGQVTQHHLVTGKRVRDAYWKRNIPKVM